MQNYTPDEATEFARRLRQSASQAERRLWSCLRAGRITGVKFKRQVPYRAYVADFSCSAARVIVEVDGPAHFPNASKEKDVARDAWFKKAGFMVLRFTDEEVMMATDTVVRTIESAVRGRIAPSPDLLRRPPSP
jgi:very-short-patch-repair endonuclease